MGTGTARAGKRENSLSPAKETKVTPQKDDATNAESQGRVPVPITISRGMLSSLPFQNFFKPVKISD